MNGHSNTIMNYYKVCPYKKWLYKSYIQKKAYFLKLINKYFKNAVVVFGDFSQSADAKYKARRGPIKYFKQFLVRHNVKVIHN